MPNSNLGGSTLGGGPYNGYSPNQTINAYKDNNDDVIGRRILVKSWNAKQLFAQNGYKPIVGPFRGVNNMGDFLGRVNYSCGGPNPQSVSKFGYGRLIGSVPEQCDGTGIAPTTCNPKFVADSSDYMKFKRLRAVNQNYNDSTNVGDAHNGSYVALMAIHRR